MGAEPTVKDHLTAALALIGDEPDWSHRMALAQSVPVLRLAMKSFPRAADRQRARSAYRLACAALGMDHE